MTETLPEFLLHWAECTPATVFVDEPDRGAPSPTAEAARLVAGHRARLQRLGVQRGDRVALLGDNSCAWIAAYLGAMAHGAVAAPLNTRHAEGDLDRTLDDLDPAAIVGDPPYLSRVPERYRSRVLASTDVDGGRSLPRRRWTAPRRGPRRSASSATPRAPPASRAAS